MNLNLSFFNLSCLIAFSFSTPSYLFGTAQTFLNYYGIGTGNGDVEQDNGGVVEKEVVINNLVANMTIPELGESFFDNYSAS